MERTVLDSATADLLEAAIHNLKGPASRLRLVSQLLTKEGAALDEDTRSLLKHIEASAADVGVVAEGLRSYVELCARPVERELVDLGVLARAATDILGVEIAKAGVAVTQTALPAAHVDRFLITWVFQELLTNAIRFRSADAPEVRISTATGGPANWYIAISDNGPGIEPAVAARAFRPFKKLSAEGGAGIGLTICRKIIEKHGGEMWIEPRDGGAEFRFFVAGGGEWR